MIFLPWPPSTARLKAFWLVMSLGGTLVLFSGLMMIELLNIQMSLLVSMVVAIGLSVLGWLRPLIGMHPYRGFNKLVRLLASFVKKIILRMLYGLMWVAGGINEHSLRLEQPKGESSQWIALPDSVNGNGHSSGVTTWKAGRSHYAWSLGRWSLHSGNWWMFGFMGLLMMMAVCEESEESAHIPTNMYTLY